MALSSVSITVDEGAPLEVATFNRSGALHIMWTTQNGMKAQIQWRVHTGDRFTETVGQMSTMMKNIVALYQSSSDALLILWDDNSNIYGAKLSYLTGAVITPMSLVAKGIKPCIVRRNDSDSNLLLSYLIPEKSIFIRESLDGGMSWGPERPVLTNRVLNSSELIVFPFDDEHLSIMQVGKQSRALFEIGSWFHSRPVSKMVWHPTDAGKIYVSEPNGAELDLSDYLRGALFTTRNGSSLFNIGGYRLGTDDSVGAVALLDITGASPSVSASATPTLPSGSTLNKMSLTPAHDTVITLGSVGKLVDADCSSTVLYAVKRSDIANPTNGGYLYAVLLSDLSFSAVVSGLAACRAVAVGIPDTGTPIVFVATKESSQESLRIYSENGLTPSLQATHKLPAVANAISVSMTSSTVGTVMVSMVDRLNVYELNGLTSPLRMRLSIPVLNRGQFLQTRIAPNGNIVAAMGNAGVGVFSPAGEMVSQILPSEIIAPSWTAKTYSLNDLVRPSVNAPFSALRLFYKCTTAGASGVNEPKWASTGTTSDGNAVWTVQGSTDTYVTSVLIDSVRKRIYAAGVLGGSTGTQGRVFSISAKTLLGG